MACREAQIHAENASYFNFIVEEIEDWLGGSTALGISIWFPPRTESSKGSNITAMGEGLNGYNGYIPIHFYALNGFEDVHIDYRGDYFQHGGIMHCHDGYLDSCWFANDSYSCNARNTICDCGPTCSPTIDPSESPSEIPTAIPTINPTSTTSSPTDIPTSQSSESPSYNPTIHPSNQTIESKWRYAVDIVITLSYDTDSNLSSIQIDRILPNITRDIIDDIITSINCIQKDGYIIIVVDTINITQIEVQIMTCNQDIGDDFVAKLQNSSFEDDIIEETEKYIKIDKISITLNANTLRSITTTEI